MVVIAAGRGGGLHVSNAFNAYVSIAMNVTQDETFLLFGEARSGFDFLLFYSLSD
ncbi:hypothetical protein CPter291_4076 [Collimonas pratensis]|uniref:Uncharacterized protein n=1 Tax=Collimonas pratensis TaxID=279113 RepID=A0ABN4MI21_9BURK|nr:hypothetical protein CPter291_4076 [Collimonas pratensis]